MCQDLATAVDVFVETLVHQNHEDQRVDDGEDVDADAVTEVAFVMA